MHGLGKLEMKEGTYEGLFVDESFRSGTLILKNGDVYTGNFYDRKLNGKGTLLCKTGEKYTGKFEYNIKGGTFILELPDGTRKKQEYKSDVLLSSITLGKTTCLSGNCIDGIGTFLLETGEQFTGPFKNGKMAGQGKMVKTNGSIRSEDWEGDSLVNYYASGKGCISGDCRDGQGTFVDENDNKYTGTFKNRIKTGQGVLAMKNGNTVAQEWNDGNLLSMSIAGKTGCLEGNCKDGPGSIVTLVAISGNELVFVSYAGGWKGGKIHGKGKLTQANGDVYEGDFKEGRMEGNGTYTYLTGEKQTGEFVDGICVAGTGYLRGTWFPAKEIFSSFTGTWKKGEIKGRGKYAFGNGDVFEGEFSNNILEGDGSFTDRHGGQNYEFAATGLMTFANGDKFEGEFEFGRPVNGTFLYKKTGKTQTTKELNKEAREQEREENRQKRLERAAIRNKEYQELLERDRNSCGRCEGSGRVPMNEVRVQSSWGSSKMETRAVSIYDSGKTCPSCNGSGQKRR